MKIMGVDPSTKTGYALLESKEAHPFDHIDLIRSGEITAEQWTGFDRVHYTVDRFNRILQYDKPDLVVLEGFAYGNNATLVTLVEIATILKYKMYVEELPWLEVAPNTLKKFVTGSGAAKKDKVMLEVYKRWGFEGSDNECDAYGLAMFGMVLIGKADIPAKNKEAVMSWAKNHVDECKQLQKF